MNNSLAANHPKKRLFTTRELTFTALMAVLIVVCSWLTIPAAVPFTLQTFAVFFALELLGGKNGTFAVLVYLILGAVGLPVFSQFKGGIGALFDLTGGYILGFLLTGVVFLLAELVPAEKTVFRIARNVAAMLAGLALCYTFGTFWFIHIYRLGDSIISFSGALKLCVLPYLSFDLAKLALAVLIAERLRKRIAVR